jgi:hypothetical protein
MRLLILTISAYLALSVAALLEWAAPSWAEVTSQSMHWGPSRSPITTAPLHLDLPLIDSPSSMERVIAITTFGKRPVLTFGR